MMVRASHIFRPSCDFFLELAVEGHANELASTSRLQKPRKLCKAVADVNLQISPAKLF
jgi:hypothetical protein